MSADIPATVEIVPYPSRTVLAWTPEDYVRATAEADSGALRTAADFSHAIMRDGYFSGVLQQRTLGMLALPSVIETADGSPVPEIPQWPTAFSEAEQVRLLNWGLILGYGWARQSLKVLKGEWQLYVETWDARWFSWQDSQQCWYVEGRTGDYRTVFHKVTPGNGWILYTPYGKREPWKHGLWHALAVPYLAKLFAIDDRSREAEVTSILVGLTKGLTDAQQEKYLAALQDLARDSRVVLPEDCDLKIVSRSDSAKASIYNDIINWANNEATVTIASQVTTTEGSEGFSSGRVQKSVLSSVMRAQEETFSTTVGEQCLTPWATISIGWDGPKLYQRWQVQDAEDLLSQSYAIGQFAASVETVNRVLAGDGVRIDVATLVARTGIPLIKLPPEVEEKATQELLLAPTDIARIVSVNEGRISLGLPPESGGDMKLAEVGIAQTIEQEAGIAQAEAEAAPEPIALPAVPKPTDEPLEEESTE